MKIKKEKGFTIIEVMIVLAIAGMIMAIVFFAVPALQRNAHNTQRSSDASHLAGIVQEYASNHQGTLPTTAQLATYIGSDKFSIMNTAVTVTASGATAVSGTTTNMVVHPGTICDTTTNKPSTTNANTKSFAIDYMIELSGGGSDNACFSN